MNYLETYAPVVSFVPARDFLQISVHQKFFRPQLVVRTAFLDRMITVDIWVASPRGLDDHQPQIVKLQRAVYGLKQAHLAWHIRLCTDLQNLGFCELPSAPCVFRKCFGAEIIFLLVYVHDMLALRSKNEIITESVPDFSKLYEIRTNYSVEFFLGVKFTWDSSGVRLTLSQPLNTSSIFLKFNRTNCISVSTPMAETFWKSLKADNRKELYDPTEYQKIIGLLMFLTQQTRFDILAAITIFSRFRKIHSCTASVRKTNFEGFERH